MDSGVATRPIADMDAYRMRLRRFVYQSGRSMEPVFEVARKTPKRIAYAEGEDERVLRAAQVVIDEGLAKPSLVGRLDVIERRIKQFGLRLKPGDNCEVVNIHDDPRYNAAWNEYYQLCRRKGVTRAQAREDMYTRPTVVSAILLQRGDVDAMLCGTQGNFGGHLRYVRNIIGTRPGVKTLASLQMLILPERQLFICDTHVNRDPTAEQLAEMTLLAVDEVRRFGLEPSVALLSHSSFGSSDAPSAVKMREAVELILERAPDLAVEGEMRADSALSKAVRDDEFPNSRLCSDANLLVMPNIDAANITYNALRMTSGGGISVGGILLGAAKAVHIMAPSSTVRRLVNMTAVAVAGAGETRRD